MKVRKRETKKTMNKSEIEAKINPSLKHRYERSKKKVTAGSFGSASRTSRKNKISAVKRLWKKIRDEDSKIKNSLWKSFKEEVDSPNFENTLGEMKIFTGAMGSGKTWTLVNKMAKYLFEEKGIDAIIIGVPQTEVVNVDEWVKSSKRKETLSNGKTKTISTYNVIGLDDDTIKEASRSIECDEDFVALMTNSKITNGTGNSLVNKLNKNGKKFAIFIDESHCWLISHYTNMQDTSGNSNNKKYRAKLFEFIGGIASYNPHVYGLTATANREQTGVIETANPNTSLTFRTPNKLLDPINYIFRNAWFDDKGDDNFMDVDNEYEVEERVINFLTDFYDIQDLLKAYNMKQVMMWQVNTANSNNQYKFDYVIKMIARLVSENDFEVETKKVIAVLSSAYTGFYDLDGKTFVSANEEDVLDALRDPDHPASHMVVVQKGRMALTINNLTALVSFRQTEKEISGSSNEKITISPLQLLGRLVRMFISKNNKEVALSDSNGNKFFTLLHYLAKTDEESLGRLFKSNSFRVLLANSDTWKTAIEDFRADYVNTLDDAKVAANKVRNDFSILNSTIAPTEIKENGGTIANANGADFEFQSVIALLELVEEYEKETGKRYIVHYENANSIERFVNRRLRKYLRKYPKNRSFISGKTEDVEEEFEIDVDAYIAPEGNETDLVIGFSCKCSLKDSGGDAILDGIRHMEEFLDIPAVGLYRLYDLDEVTPSQAKSNPFYNERSSNFYNKVKVLRNTDKVNYRLFGLNTSEDYDEPNDKYSDVAELYDCDGYNFIWESLEDHTS